MIIHQSLHGYKNGHHKLVSSLSLSTESENKMLLFSDWSEYDGGVDGDMSYLTCYPLNDKSYYVVAKTWYAQESERPGSVWTHSLIISLDELGDELNFAMLESYFHRPDDSKYDYSLPIEVSAKDILSKRDVSIPFEHKGIIEAAYYSLSISTDKIIIPVKQPSKYYRSLLLSMLQHLPFGIIRNVAACSGWSAHKKIDLYAFNLVFCSGINSTLGLLKESNLPAAYYEQLHHISKSITEGSSTLPELIKFFSDDIGTNPNKLYTVIYLVCALENAYSKVGGQIAYSEIIETITRCFPSSDEGSSLKKLFMGKNTAVLFCQEYDYYASLSIINDNIFADWESIDFKRNACAYLLSSYENFVLFYKQLLLKETSLNTNGHWLLNYASQNIPHEWIPTLFTEYWNIFIQVATINPKILSGDYWFKLTEARFKEIMPIVLVDKVNVDLDWSKPATTILFNKFPISTVQISILYNKVSDLANLIMDHFDNGSIQYGSSWISFVANHPEDILVWMERKEILSNNTIDFLVTNINANSQLVKSMGSGVWKSFYNSSEVFNSLRHFIFLFALARNWKDDLSLLMLKRAFVNIHNSLAQNNIHEDEWIALTPYLASLPFWQNWDNCKKLRVGVVETLLSLGYRKDVLYDFTATKSVNAMLLKIWNKKVK